MSMDDEVPVKLTEADREERHDSLLYHLGEAERLEQKLRDDTKAAKTLIAAEWSECYRLRRVLLEDQESRRQGELFVTDEQATEALAEVAKAAEMTTEAPQDAAQDRQDAPGATIVAPDDPVHAADQDRSPDGDVARPCPACRQGTCEVHAHAFEGDELRCSRCGKVKRAKIHRVEEAYAFGETEPAPEIASDSPLVHGA